MAGNENQWRARDYATKAPGFRSSNPLNATGAGPWYGIGAEPSAGSAITVLASKNQPVTSSATCSYRISANFTTWEGDPVAPAVTFEITNGPVTREIFRLSQRTSSNPGITRNNSALSSARFRAPTAGAWTFQIRFAFPTAQNTNDIYLRDLRLSYA